MEWHTLSAEKSASQLKSNLTDGLSEQAAKNLLLTTDKSLVDIASECGFSSQSYFNYAFKKAEKITPNQYRFSKNNSYFSV